MSLWTIAWLGWGLIFAVIEGMALFNSTKGDTLSEHAWAWLGYAATGSGELRSPSGWTRLRRFLLLAGLAWLSIHLLTGGVF
jgi:hypothetical protein